MNTELAQTMTFQQRIEEKIKDSFADLVTEIELKAIVERGIEKALWEHRTIPTGKLDYNGRPDTRNAGPLVDEIVEKHLRPIITNAVQDWLKENPEKLVSALNSAVQAGVAECVLQTLDSRFQNLLQGVEYQTRFLADEIKRRSQM